MNYEEFVINKSHIAKRFAFKPTHINPKAFDFQNELVEWACITGRSAIFADCGLGKTLMQLAWSQNVIERTNKPVLILSPLSVSIQTTEEASKFGYEASRSKDGTLKTKIITTNYERLDKFNPNDFSGVVCDESSIIKNFDGSTKGAITEFMKKVDYRLLCSATPSPNDFIELGTSSEALGYMGYMDMLAQYFKNDENSLHPAFIGSKWRFKSHGEKDFWRWVASWARAIRKPSDLGFDDGDFLLPKLIQNTHKLEVDQKGVLFTVPAQGLNEERLARKETIEERCELATKLCEPHKQSVAWCHLNAEADLLEEMLPNAQQLAGRQDEDEKEEIIKAFKDGEIKNLVTKPKIAAWGMNWQHCNHMTYFADHSYEQYYQSIRRFYRFGQKNTVYVDQITTEELVNVTKNLARKAAACETMFVQLVEHMSNAKPFKSLTEHNNEMELPAWV
jgi:hypothetical protein